MSSKASSSHSQGVSIPSRNGSPSATSPPELNNEIIKLQVGERHFTTNNDTLTDGSDYFAVLFTWKNYKQPDGSIFVDRDGNMFEHILCYLRTKVFPFFYSQSSGYDHAKYQLLLAEAKYFQISSLKEFINTQSYAKAIKIERSVQTLDTADNMHSETSGIDTKVHYVPTWETEKVYVCPRGISVHRGSSWRCGRQCLNARGDGEVEHEEEQVLKLVEIRTKLLFDASVLKD